MLEFETLQPLAVEADFLDVYTLAALADDGELLVASQVQRGMLEQWRADDVFGSTRIEGIEA